jgi:2-polyprenyl-6-methoxyphenol hydroxylase-like FAD-dependent oxidoreductase
VVIGADGTNSRVARAMHPEQYNDKPILQAGSYSYFADLPVNGFEITIRPDRGWAALPTNDGLTLVVVGWPYAEHAANKVDVEGNFLTTLELSPAFADRVRSATRVDRFSGSPVPNFFRKPYGPGWALVGDAGYTKDPITAQGISNAFRDAELCAGALDATFTGEQSFDDAMESYHTDRDLHSMPMYEFTTQLATLQPPPPDLQQLLGNIHGNQPAMDAFVSITAGTLSPMQFFDPANLAALMGAPAVSH